MSWPDRYAGYETVSGAVLVAQGRSRSIKSLPGGDRNKEMIGVFRNRSPLRPNPIGISRVELLEVGVNDLHVRGLDAIDGTPIIDLKSPISNTGG